MTKNRIQKSINTIHNESYHNSAIRSCNVLISNMKLNEAIKLASDELKEIEEGTLEQITYLILLGEAYVYSDQFTLASNAFFDSLKLLQNNPNADLEAKVFIGLSYISRFIGDYSQAISYGDQALELNPTELETSIKIFMSNGISKGKLENFIAAKLDLNKALTYATEIKSLYYEASLIKALGDIYYRQKKLDKAQTNFERALILASNLKHNLLICLIQISLGRLLLDLNQDPVNNFESALVAANNAQFLQGQSMAHEALSTYYEKINHKELAYESLRKSLDLTKENESTNKRDFYKRQLDHLGQLKDKEIELLTEIAARHQEIKDSITYAKRIQSAILPPTQLISEHLKNSFLLYKPKDIVSGDFYWMEHKDNTLFFAAADCTGHGVPGAMVSVVCSNALNYSLRVKGITDPGKLLDMTRQIVIERFERSVEEVKDGMDIALCSLDGNNLKYAGAYNPLWIVRKGATEVEEIKADKQPIGKFQSPKPYTTNNIELNKGDTFYIFSDGYADQFGGEKGKKFKTKNFKTLLLSIQNQTLEQQKEIINENFNNWMGNHEQLDDVCVMGVRV